MENGQRKRNELGWPENGTPDAIAFRKAFSSRAELDRVVLTVVEFYEGTITQDGTHILFFRDREISMRCAAASVARGLLL